MLSRRKFLKTAALAAAVESGFDTLGWSEIPSPARPTNLTVEYLKDPLGIDVRQPRLGWLPPANTQRGAGQQAYQIVAASSRNKLLAGNPDLWDSGKVASSNCAQVVYRGQVLQSQTAVHWRLRSWNQDGRPSQWSAPALWEMGLLKQSDWKAKWIADVAAADREHTYTGPAPFFRKAFQLPSPVTSARAYICGLGFCELYLNGKRVGDQVLSPNQTNYDSRKLHHLLYPYRDHARMRALYVTYDVTSYLRPGPNVAGIILGNGWYNQRDRLAEGYLWYHSPKLIFQLECQSADGNGVTVASDETWKVSTSGPIIHDGIFTGEDYDARLEMDQWLEPAFNDAGWMQAQTVPAPQGTLEAQISVPDRVVRSIEPVSERTVRPGVRRFDLGQNLAGWTRLKARGPRGSRITMRFFDEMGSDYGQVDSYVLKGTGTEVHEPRFTWHGFRTIEVQGTPETLAAASLEGRIVHSDVQTAGRFECSNDLFNRILHNARWSQLSNMHCGVPSDCPHRERLGYTGDGQVDAESAMLNFRMAPFYSKWIRDIHDSQSSVTGFVPHTVPFEGGGGGPPWGCACVIIPWLMHLYYGDRRVLEEQYSCMRQWVEYLRGCTDATGLVVHEEPGSWCLGEWATPTPVKIPKPLVNTCYYAYVSRLMARIAGVLGRTQDARHFAALARSAGNAVNQKFFNASIGQYYDGRQGANVFPLAFGVTPPAQVKAVFNRLVEINLHQNNGHFDTGMYGTPLTLDVLTAGGRADVAYTLMNQTTFPSYGFELAKGATTLWENWDGSGSHNHAMYASVARWFYKALAGIAPDPRHPGFKNIIVRPYPLESLSYVRAEYDSIRGKIASHWEQKDGKLQWNLEIPPASTATIFLPTDKPRNARESGNSLLHSRGLKLMGIKNRRVVCAARSGRYAFEIQDPNGLV